MVSLRRRIDFRKDPPAQILAAVAMPLFLTYFVQIATAALTNKIYSLYIGPEVFAVMGYLNTITSTFTMCVSSMAAAAWLTTARFFTMGQKEEAQNRMMNAVCGIFMVELVAVVPMVTFADTILTLAHVPEDIYSGAKTYYIINLCSLMLAPVATFFLSILNGTGSSARLFFNNLFTVCENIVVTAVLMALLRLGLVGVALLPGVNAAVQISVYLVLMKMDGFVPKLTSVSRIFRFQGKEIWKMIRYGLLITLQNLMCNAGYLAVSLQANHFLPKNYISVISVMLPFTVAFCSLSQAVNVFVPPNFAAGDRERTRKFLRLSLSVGFLYAAFCMTVYMLCGRWYYSRLWEDPQVITYGQHYWFCFGLGMPFLSVLFTLRFYLDAIGKGKLSLLSGVGELVGNLIAAFVLIPRFGYVGHSVSQPLGWFLASVMLFSVYGYLRRNSKKAVPQPQQ